MCNKALQYSRLDLVSCFHVLWRIWTQSCLRLDPLADLALPQTPPRLVLALTQTQTIWYQLHHSHKAYLLPSSIQVINFGGFKYEFICFMCRIRQCCCC